MDALKPAMLERARREGRAPLFGEIMRRGHYCSDCVSVFPSVTPAAAASITTGRLPDEHGVPSICWYHRGEGRYVDYGSSGATVRTFGVLRTITDTVHNMNFDHLSRRTPTVFEQLEDAGVRTACTPFLIYRGRTRHEMGLQGWMRRVAQAANLRQAVYGPSELFYGELYASQDVDCQASLARPGTRDPVLRLRRRLHRALRPVRLPAALAAGQRSLLPPARALRRRSPPSSARTVACNSSPMRPGGQEQFLSDHAVILMSDHAQIAVTRRVQLAEALSDWRVLQPNDPDPESADLAVAPGARSAMVYALAEDGARERLRGRVLRRLRSVEGVDLLAWMEGDEACLWSDRGELRFAPGTQPDRSPRDDLGRGRAASTRSSWRNSDGLTASRAYPDALRRVWAALHCPGAGDVLVSAQREYEFVDWGGSDHVGGGSHGSLRRGDSLAALAFLNCGPDVAVADPAAVVDHRRGRGRAGSLRGAG